MLQFLMQEKGKMKRDDRIEVLAKTMISGLDGKITKAQQVTIFYLA